MTRDSLNNLEHIRLHSLSDEERARMWATISAKLPETSVVSPFSLMSMFASRKMVTAFLAFIVILGTVGASNSAMPDSVLFPVDLAVERVESTIDPASRADHARERLEEFSSRYEATAAPEATADAPMQKTMAPQAETMMMFSVEDNAAGNRAPLPPEVQAAVERTRNELHAIEAEATLKGDTETLAQIQTTIEEFENYVSTLR